MSEKKHIGVTLAILILLFVFVINGFIYNVLEVDFNLSANPLPFFVSLLLFILVAIAFRLYKPFYRKPVLFVISVFILQNLFISGMANLVYGLADFDSRDAVSIIAPILLLPTIIIVFVIWGRMFDKRRNKIRKDIG